jgi:hypothetical protein
MVEDFRDKFGYRQSSGRIGLAATITYVRRKIPQGFFVFLLRWRSVYDLVALRANRDEANTYTGESFNPLDV